MTGRTSWVHSQSLGLLRFGVVAGIALAFFVLPHAALADKDAHLITSVDTGGTHIVAGSVVTPDNISFLTNFWTINFSYPYFVNGSRAALAVMRGTPGNPEGGTLVAGQNYSLQSEAFGTGVNFPTKQFGLTPLGSAGLPSGTYTVVLAELSNPGTFNMFVDWLQSGDPAGVGLEAYSTLTFTYDATAHPVEIPNAIHTVSVGGRTITAGDEVFRKELGALNGNTDNYWTFNFDWPNQVQNQAALFMVFRGTYGNLEGGTPQSGVNYGSTVQAWAAGNNDIAKFINLPPLKNASTTAGTYTVMVAERDPKYLNLSDGQQALWFGSGGTQGIAPKSYSFLTFDFKADEPYPVVIVPGILGSAEVHGVWVLDPITHIYDNLVDTLDANGYTRGETLFTFPYDWKKSNVDTALLLRDKINEVQSLCHCKKVDLVAHSMGGLVSRQYIQSANYEGDVDHLIFLGTPHLGAPKDYLTWEAGEHDTTAADFILGRYLTHLAREAGFSTEFDYVHLGNIKSVKELLPVYSYLFDSSNHIKIYPDQYPSNLFLQNLLDSSSQLFSNGVSVRNVVGDSGSDNTITSISVASSNQLPLWLDGKPVTLGRGGGDDTVPIVSASPQFIPATLTLTSDHTRLPTSAESYVFNQLTGRVASTLFTAPMPIRFILIQALSPIDINVTAPDGKRVGAGGASDLSEIPGAFYTGSDTDTEFIVIPDPQDGEYKISAVGTGSGGQYTIATNYITDTAVVQKDVTGTIGGGATVDSFADLTASAPDPLAVHGTDIDPPVITISSPLAQSYLHSDLVPVTVSAVDDGSGVAVTQTLWDGAATSTTNLDLFFSALGPHTFTASSTDTVGNATSTSVVLTVVTTPESAILDINRTFTLGWVKKANVRDTLVQKMNSAIKIEKKIVTLTEQLPGKPNTIKKIEKLQSRLDKVLGVNVVKELDAQLGKGNITQQGYDLIKADIQWLLNQP